MTEQSSTQSQLAPLFACSACCGNTAARCVLRVPIQAHVAKQRLMPAGSVASAPAPVSKAVSPFTGAAGLVARDGMPSQVHGQALPTSADGHQQLLQPPVDRANSKTQPLPDIFRAGEDCGDAGLASARVGETILPVASTSHPAQAPRRKPSLASPWAAAAAAGIAATSAQPVLAASAATASPSASAHPRAAANAEDLSPIVSYAQSTMLSQSSGLPSLSLTDDEQGASQGGRLAGRGGTAGNGLPSNLGEGAAAGPSGVVHPTLLGAAGNGAGGAASGGGPCASRSPFEGSHVQDLSLVSAVHGSGEHAHEVSSLTQALASAGVGHGAMAALAPANPLLRSPRGSGSGVLNFEQGAWEIDPAQIELGQRIGIGSYGEVYKGTWGGTEVAVKRFLETKLSPQLLQEFKDEVAIMARLRHPNVVLFMGAITRPGELAIVTQFMPRGSLFRLLHRAQVPLDPRRRLMIAMDIARGE